MSRIFKLTKIDPSAKCWEGRKDADLIRFCADDEATAREHAVDFHRVSGKWYAPSPWADPTQTNCELEYESPGVAGVEKPRR